MVEEISAFRVDQFNDRGGADHHYFGTAREILEQCDGRLDAFVDFVGTAGTFAGCAKYFKERSKGVIKCFVVEPAGAGVLAKEAAMTGCSSKDDASDEVSTASNDGGCGHFIQGGGYSKTFSDLKLLRDNSEYIDGYIQITDTEAVETTRLLAKTDGVFGGYSGGANVAAAVKLLQTETFRDSSICAVICDSGLKCMSTNLWNEGG